VTRTLSKPRTTALTVPIPNAWLPFLDQLAKGAFGALWGRTREDVAAQLIRAQLVQMLSEGRLK
jgi:hypothetical protein